MFKGRSLSVSPLATAPARIGFPQVAAVIETAITMA